MTCHSWRTECRRFGKRANRQRYQCSQCRKAFTNACDNTLDGYVHAHRESRTTIGQT